MVPRASNRIVTIVTTTHTHMSWTIKFRPEIKSAPKRFNLRVLKYCITETNDCYIIIFSEWNNNTKKKQNSQNHKASLFFFFFCGTHVIHHSFTCENIKYHSFGLACVSKKKQQNIMAWALRTLVCLHINFILWLFWY